MIFVAEQQPYPLLEEFAREMFSEQGVLAKSPDFEFREQQQELGVAVAQALATRKPLLAEAGTGVGKSLAYLLPAAKYALESGQKAVISTHTINLQEQLVRKDLPIVQKVLGAELPAVLLKGRGNYLCPMRLRRALDQSADLFSSSEDTELKRIAQWAEATRDGTLSDLPFQPSMKVWMQVCSDPYLCTTRHCGVRGNCFYQEARKAALEARIVVVNHTLFFALLQQQEDAQVDSANANGFLFPNDFAILDEAHTIEQIAAIQLGMRLTQSGMKFDLQRLYNPRTKKGTLRPYQDARAFRGVENALLSVDQFFTDIEQTVHFASDFSKESRVREPAMVDDSLKNPLMELCEAIEDVKSGAESETDVAELNDALRRLKEMQGDVAGFLEQREQENVYWVERSGRDEVQYSLHGAPVSVAKKLQNLLFHERAPLVLTSATLGVGDPDFQWFRGRVGAQNARSLCVGSPFDYAEQMKIQIFKNIPEPTAANYKEKMAEAIRASLETSEGRAFVLFTSYALQREMQQRLEGFFREKGWRLLCQGAGMTRHEMVQTFRDDLSSVLFGTDSFWTGVDVPGEALSNVIVTRLPFSVPDHPLTQARIDAITARGGNAFMEYSVPEAILKMRQGVGRLIRTKKDRGMVTLIDSRIITKFYGKRFIQALPPAPIEYIP